MTRLLTLIAVSSALVLSSCTSTKSAGEGDSCCSTSKACDASSACSTGGKAGSCCATDSAPAKPKKS